MAKRSRRVPEKEPGKLHEDANEIAFRTVQAAIGHADKPVPPSERTDEEKDPTAVERGRKGGQKGGKARTETLTPEQRREIGKIAASARWKKKDPLAGWLLLAARYSSRMRSNWARFVIAIVAYLG